MFTPYGKKAASVGNGTMIAVLCKSEAQVRALHAKALQLGGRD